MQLNEHEIFENLTHHCAAIIEAVFNGVVEASQSFSIAAQDVYSADTIYEYIEELERYKSHILASKLEMPLTLKKINKLLQYLD